MWPIYMLLQSFGWAILVFTIIVKAAMLPLAIKQQKNMAKSQMFAPKVREIQEKYKNNREKQTEELQKLQAQGYNPTGGCGPMLLTFVLLFGVIDVVYKPMTHMEHISNEDISYTISIAQETEIASIFLNEYNEQDKELLLQYRDGNADIMFVTETQAKLVHKYASDEGFTKNYSEKDPDKIPMSMEEIEKYFSFSAEELAKITGDNSRLTAETVNRLKFISQKYSGASLQKELLALQTYNKYPDTFNDSSRLTNDVKGQLANLSSNMQFAGLDLGDTPQLAFAPIIIIPIMSFLLSLAQTLISQYFTKKNSPETANAGGCGMKVMIYIMPVFSLWIAFQVPAGVGFYWAVSYVFGIGQTFLTQKLYPMEKLKAEAAEKFASKKQEITTTAVVTDAETGEQKTVTTTETLSQKEINKRKLAAARKADAEKYGEEYHDEDDD